MKPGDLIKMKYIMFWHLKSNPNELYTEELFLVLENMGKTQVRILNPATGRRQRVRIECYDVVSAA